MITPLCYLRCILVSETELPPGGSMRTLKRLRCGCGSFCVSLKLEEFGHRVPGWLSPG